MPSTLAPGHSASADTRGFSVYKISRYLHLQQRAACDLVLPSGSHLAHCCKASRTQRRPAHKCISHREDSPARGLSDRRVACTERASRAAGPACGPGPGGSPRRPCAAPARGRPADAPPRGRAGGPGPGDRHGLPAVQPRDGLADALPAAARAAARQPQAAAGARGARPRRRRARRPGLLRLLHARRALLGTPHAAPEPRFPGQCSGVR